MKTIAVIGAGRLGTSLGFALSHRGYAVAAISDKTGSAARESRDFIGQGAALTDNIQAASRGEIIILSVPDDAIAAAAKELESSKLTWRGKLVFHCSGLHSSSLLQSLDERGALIASVHPSQSFPAKTRDPDAFQGVFFAIEGAGPALDAAGRIIGDLGGIAFIIQDENKPLYHAACSIASNFIVALLDTSIALLQICGLDEETGKDILLPLVDRTLQNVKNINTSKALSGPIARGDRGSVERHLSALKKHPAIRDIYVSLAFKALEIAVRNGQAGPDKARAIKALLERE